MTLTAPKFGVRFLTRKERTVRRVTKCETREIQKRLQPPAPPPVKFRTTVARPKPATLVKPKAPSKVKPPVAEPTPRAEQIPSSRPVSSSPSRVPSSSPSASINRTLQSTDLQKLSRLNCSREFSLFHKEIKVELVTNEQQLAFLQTKLHHLKNEFAHDLTEQLNLEQIRRYFGNAVQQNRDRRIKPDEFLTLLDKLKNDIKQAIDKWLRKKEPAKQPRALTEYLQRRQSRIRDLIKETLEESKKQTQSSQENSESSSPDIQSQSETPVEVIE